MNPRTRLYAPAARCAAAPRLGAWLAVAGVLLAACGGGQESAAPAGPTELGPVGEPGSGQPRLTATPEGTAVLSFIQPRDDGDALQYTVLRDDGAWSAPVTVVERGDLFVNWADLPSVVKLGEGRWIAHFLVTRPDNRAAYDIEYAISTDGRDWSAPARLNADSAVAEHGFVTFFDWGGDTGAVWLDGRRLAAAATDPNAGDGAPVGTELRFARLATDGDVLARGVVDELTCDCCKTGVATTFSGPVVAYRDRTPEEVRDVVVSRFEREAWTQPERLGDDGWRIEGCPVDGPGIAALDESVAVAWFTAADASPRVELAWSGDGGASFGPAIEVDAERPFGQADVVLLDPDTAIVSWWRAGSDEGIVLAARRVGRDGSLGPVREVANSDLSQPLDTPQLERAGDGIVFAWTAFEDNLRVRTAYARDWP